MARTVPAEVDLLLVEDNPNDVELTLRALEKHRFGHKVHVVQDGVEALRKIKADERTRTIPVVVLTSSREERDIVESYKVGVNSYIVKPVDFDKFIKLVLELGHYWLSQNTLPH